MLKDIVEVTPLPGYRLHLRFEDGVEGDVDLTTLISFDGIFAPLRDPLLFNQAHASPELGTVCWPNGADIDPDVLYAEISRQGLPSFPCMRQVE